MFDNLTALGYGLVTFAIVIGVGVVILSKFGGSVIECPTGFSSFNSSNVYASNACCNATDTSIHCEHTSTENVSSMEDTTGANATTTYLTGQMGESGLAGWTPAIIALVIGMLFLGAFIAKGGKRQY